MQWILSVFAMYYNRIHKITGHVWGERFWSRIIDNINQLFDTFRYISDNPVKAEMVRIAEEYKFGGLYQILKGIFDIVDKPEYDFLNYLGTDL
jgi:putative transposase